MNLFIHPLASAQFGNAAVGTRIAEPGPLAGALGAAVADYVFPDNGQGFITLDLEVHPSIAEYVQAGVAPVSDIPADYVVRSHRGEIITVLRREAAADLTPDGVAVIVYTREAFLADPDTSDEEKAAFVEAGHTHCWVTTLAFKGPPPPLGSRRFVRNLAGGNAAYADKTAFELRTEAAAIAEYEAQWCVVG